MSVFRTAGDTPADILSTTALVTRFLAEVAVNLASDGGSNGLSEDGAQGLFFILSAIEDSINEAVNRL